jgi:1-deoxy-D-xylulose-5-phosphate synthase
MMDDLPERAFDVGIAEQHAVTLSAGINGDLFFATSTPLFTKGHDQVIHDVAIQNLPVIFCLDRAGLVEKTEEPITFLI